MAGAKEEESLDVEPTVIRILFLNTRMTVAYNGVWIKDLNSEIILRTLTASRRFISKLTMIVETA